VGVKVEIDKEEYDDLLESSAILEALFAAGVDNWDGFDDAMANLEGEE